MTPRGMILRWRRRRRPGWVCEFGRNHYYDGCAIHGCANRDDIITGRVEGVKW